MKLSHVDDAGRATMVDVSGKDATHRSATAEGIVRMSREAFALVSAGELPKGDVLGVARIAGIMAAKRTGDLIPLCHPLGLEHVDVEAVLDEQLPGVRITATARVTARTGVEMEALTAVAVACLTVYDMAKAVDRTMRIDGIRLLRKQGGAQDWGAVAEDTSGSQASGPRSQGG